VHGRPRRDQREGRGEEARHALHLPQRPPTRATKTCGARLRSSSPTRDACCRMPPQNTTKVFARSPAGSWPVKACSRSTPSGRLCTCVAASAARVCGPPHPRAHASTRDRHQADAGTRLASHTGRPTLSCVQRRHVAPPRRVLLRQVRTRCGWWGGRGWRGITRRGMGARP
jgi:hypothetical protein